MPRIFRQFKIFLYRVLLFRNSFGREALFRTQIVSTGKIFVTVDRSVLDPHWFNADPDLAFYLSAEPDPGSQTNADSCGSGFWSDFKVT
jgi:hypothetical protein